ncbi:MAG: hypothetical protein ABSC94_13590 [Polyangiaceae bacterium]
MDQECVVAPPQPCTCPLGCCDSNNQCQPGAANTQCGSGGQFCSNCTLFGDECITQQCNFPQDAGVCNFETCPSGCCDSSGLCEQGLTGTSCGGSGTTCQNCLAVGEICSNQQCALTALPDGGRICNSENCNGCCDALGNCDDGNSDTACGGNGQRCLDCTTNGGQCFGDACQAPDGGTICSQTCAGCCDANGNCQAGFADTQCGANGEVCENCKALVPASTCDLSVAQRVCASQQTLCPAAYLGCPTALQAPVLVRQPVCPANDLQSAATACVGGANTSSCNTFLTFEANANPACSSCLEPFEYDFIQQSGVSACLAPFLDASCNHENACMTDCVTESCFDCIDVPSSEACDLQVQTGTCATYFQGDACITQALNGAAIACNSAAYANFGAWFGAVGALYCGQ